LALHQVRSGAQKLDCREWISAEAALRNVEGGE
jgi:hypothetical protein